VYAIGETSFRTKQEARATIQGILRKYSAGSVVQEPDRSLIIALIGMHPEAQKKIGSGIDYVSVERTPPYFTSNGFWIHRTDRTKTDFSYIKCFTGADSPRLKFSRAARSAVSDTIIMFRQDTFSKGVAICPMTSTPLDFETCHIDHAPPNVFSKIIDDFIATHEIDLSKVQYCPKPDGSTTEHFLSAEFENDFVSFHNDRATLRAVDPVWNVKAGNRSST